MAHQEHRSEDVAETDERLATVLPFPSNRIEPTAAVPEPRLRDVIGEVVRDERQLQDRTLADVADAAHVSLPYLSEVERGRKEISSELLASVGDALDLTLVELLERCAQRLRVSSQDGSGIQLSAA